MCFCDTIKFLTILFISTLFVAASMLTEIAYAENVNSLYSFRSTYADDAVRPPVGQLSLKITVDEEGIYEITKDTLRDAGFLADTLDPKQIRMMYRGEPLAYQFVNDNGDTLFDDDEKIRFYGWAFDGSRYEQFFVDKNVYWLWLDADTNGERVLSQSNPVATNRTDVEQFPESLYIEKNRIFRTTKLKLDEFSGFEADSWFWAKYGQRYNGRYVSALGIFVGPNETLNLTGTAGSNANIIAKYYSLEVQNPALIVQTTTANQRGEWTIPISNTQQASYDLTIEADDGSEIIMDQALAVNEEIVTQFFDKKRYFFDIPHPAQTDDAGRFVAEFMTKNDGYYTTTATLADVSSTITLTDADYGGAEGNFVNRNLQHGENMLEISGENVTLAGTQEMGMRVFRSGDFNPNRVWFNGITVDYTRLLTADNNELKFQYDTAGDHNFLVDGFEEGSADNMLVWDISDRLHPLNVALIASDRSLSGTFYQWRIGKTIADGGEAQIFATVRSNVRSVTSAQLETYTAIDIDPADNAGAEWVAISHADFMTSTADVATYRQNTSGLSTHVVDVEHIINQYGFGYNFPEAIRNYMIHAYRDRVAWETAPRYLLLVGDSDWNLLDRYCSQCTVWDQTEPTFVVADYQFIDQYTGMNTTDHRYAMLDSDDVIPDIAVGRIPVKTSDEVDIILQKMQTYEQAIYKQEEWVSEMMFIADDADAGGNFCNSVQIMQDLITANAPGVYQFNELCFDDDLPAGFNQLSDTDQAIALTVIKDSVRTIMYDSVNNEGVGILNYRGHGAVDNWAEGLLNLNANAVSRGHLAGWKNRRPTVIISADCLDTEFGRSALPSLGETLLKLDGGGSVAHFGSTGLGLDSDHKILMDGFYGGVTQTDPIHTIGDAAANAKKHYIDVRGSRNLTDITEWTETLAFTVLGDPALTMPTSNLNPFPEEPFTVPIPTDPDEPSFDIVDTWFLPSIQGGY